MLVLELVGLTILWAAAVGGWLEGDGRVIEGPLVFSPAPPLVVVVLFSLSLVSSSSPSRASGTGERLTSSLLGGCVCVGGGGA